MTQHKNIFVALAVAQAEFSAPKKDANNPAFKTKYADLSSVVNAVAPALSKHGVCIHHYPDARDIGRGMEACMVTALVHGETETRVECAIPLIVGKNDMQGFKSATTYAKRIGLESVTGVAPDDDDGNDASRHVVDRDERAATKASADRIAAEVHANSNAAALVDALDRCETETELMTLWTQAKGDQRKPLLTRPDVTAAKDAAKARLMQPDPFSDAA